MNEIIKKNREIEAIEYLNSHKDDFDECWINNHWEDFLEGTELSKVTEADEWLSYCQIETENQYAAPLTISMFADEDGDIWVGGNESWASQCFDLDVPMGEIIDYLVKELMDEYKKINSYDGYDHIRHCHRNISDYTNDWKEYLDMYDEDPEEYTLEEYAIDNGFVYYDK